LPRHSAACDGSRRSFEERAIQGRIYQTIDDIRAAVRNFFDLYNAEWEWLVEKKDTQPASNANRVLARTRSKRFKSNLY
jgi:hypothetical protein